MPADIVEEVAATGGPSRAGAWWVEEEGLAGPRMPDDAIDGIEEVANAETISD